MYIYIYIDRYISTVVVQIVSVKLSVYMYASRVEYYN